MSRLIAHTQEKKKKKKGREHNSSVIIISSNAATSCINTHLSLLGCCLKKMFPIKLPSVQGIYYGYNFSFCSTEGFSQPLVLSHTLLTTQPHPSPVPPPALLPGPCQDLSCANSPASVCFGSLAKYLWRVIRAERLNGDHCNVSN